jgi:putative sugar O-methyltransferase
LSNIDLGKKRSTPFDLSWSRLAGYLLSNAAERDNLKAVQWLHKIGAALEARDNEPICRACANGQLDIVRYLHNNGVKLTARHNAPLGLASEHGHLDVVKYLHENGVALTVDGNEPMLKACANGHLDVVKYLHENGVALSVDGHSEPLRIAAAGGHSQVVRYLHESGAGTRMLTDAARLTIQGMKQELAAAPVLYQPSKFWKEIGELNERILDWSGEANFKRTLNQNYFNFIPQASNDVHMIRARRLMRNLDQGVLNQVVMVDPDCDPESWISWYPPYFIFKEPNRATKLQLYREYLASTFEYALQRDRSGLLTTVEEAELGNPLRVRRRGRLISQDVINSIRERNSILAGTKLQNGVGMTVGELGAGYGRLGYVILKTTQFRYFVFDIPPALYVSQWYLTTLFPERRAFRFRPFRNFYEIEQELSQADIAFFTANQLEKFPSGYFDVFATISSLHEMRRDQIAHWMGLMGRTTKYGLYLKQQKNYKNPYDDLVIGRNDYPAPPGWSPTQDRFDLINPGFFERIYTRSTASE